MTDVDGPAAEPRDPSEAPSNGGEEAAPRSNPSGRRSPRRWPTVALAVSCAVLSVVVIVLGALLAADDDRDADLRRAAGTFGELLVTYDHRDPQQHRDAVLDRVTSSFAGEYEQAFDQGLGQLIEQLEASSRGFVKDVYTTEVARGQALAIVVVDVETTGTSGPRRIADVYVRLTMIEIDDEWLVDDVADLSFGVSAPGTADPGVTEGAPGSASTSLP